MKKLFVLIAVLLIGAITVIGCAPTPPTAPAKPAATQPAPAAKPAAPATPQPQYGGVFKIVAVGGGPTVFGYPPEQLPDGFMYNRPCVESLLYFDQKGEPTPNLATSVEVAPDGKWIKMSLRKGVKFHDGTDFNAEAVRFNLDAHRAVRPELKVIASIDVIDEYTVRFNLSKFNNVLFAHLATSAGSIMSPTAIQKNGKEWARTNPVSTGPHKFKDYQRSVFLKYDRFDGYWDKGKPYIDGMEYNFFADATTALMALETGAGQMMMGVQRKDAKGLEQKGFKINSYVDSFAWLAPDSKNPDSPFANKKVREAVEYAIEKDAIVAGTGYGYTKPVYQIVPQGWLGYNPDLKPRTYNPEKAKQLLTEAGYPQGFKTKLITRTPVEDSTVAIQTYLSKVGITAELDVADAARYSAVQTGGWKNGLLVGGTGINPNPLQRIDADLAATSFSNISFLRPEGYQVALDQAMSAIDVQAREKFTKQVAQIAADEAMITPLWVLAQIAAMNKSVQNCDYMLNHHMIWHPAETWLSK